MGTNAARRSRPSAGSKKRAKSKKKGSATFHGREMVGLGMIAAGVFLGLVVYAGMNGGPAGRGLEDLVRLGIGRAVAVAPVLMVVAGIAIILRDDLLSAVPFRIGASLVAGGSLLAFAAGSFGLDGPERLGWFTSDVMMESGGLFGEVLYAVTGNIVGDIGTAVIVILALVAGVLLVSGASLARVLRGSGRGAAVAGRTVGRGVAAATFGAVRGGRRVSREVLNRWPLDTSGSRPRLAAVPTSDHPPLDGAGSFPDIFEEQGTLPPSPSLNETPSPDGSELDTDPGLGDAAAFSAIVADLVPVAIEEDDGQLAMVDEGEETVVPAAIGAVGKRLRPPSIKVLRRSNNTATMPASLIAETSRRLVETLGHFGINATVADAVSGPRVTRYELQLAPGTKVSRVVSLRDDLAYALAARDEIRIIAPIPGKQAIGVEVPNPESSLVTLGDIYRSFPEGTGALVAWLGLDLGGKAVFLDLARMPHLLIAGSTGTGKSVCLNSLLAGILLRATPDQLRMILIDPKKVELNHYESLPHLLTPVVTNMRNAAAVLSNVVREMESRYERMGLDRARSLRDWNEIRVARGEEAIPMIMVVIDELADLMMVAPADVEDSIIRLAQKSRAVGIHLVLATQRPSVDVITGMIKANVPSRIAFAVSSQVDSRVILDATGAESLLGGGDMLFRPVGSSRLQRLQGAYVSEEEIKAITDHWRAQGRPEMREELLERPEETDDPMDADADDLVGKAIEMVVAQGTASVSLLQRRLGVGYARAGRLVDMMERMGVVSGHEGSKPRTVLVTEADLPRLLRRSGDPETDLVEA
jgi:S-DNA-T family DNA segregation ATPase FtsK/SpoIIIE